MATQAAGVLERGAGRAATPAREPTAGSPPPLADLGDLAFLGFRALPLRAWLAIARLQGRMHYRARGGARTIVRDNLASIVGPEADASALDRLTVEFFERERMRNLLLLLAPRLSEGELDSLFELEGTEALDRALAGGRGAVLLLSHLNSVGGFLAVALLRQRGYDVRVALPTAMDGFRPTRVRQRLNRLLGARTFHQMTGAFFAQFNVRPIVKLLQGNAAVAFTGDGLHSASFVTVDFMGRPIPFPTGAMSIAQLTGAPVVPLYVVPVAGNGLRFVLEEGFSVGRAGDPASGLEARVAGYARRLEEYVRGDPAGWQHCRTERVLDTLEGWTDRPLSERYAL